MIDLILCAGLTANPQQLPVFYATDDQGSSVQGDRGRTKASDGRGTTIRGGRGK